jgi:hypothetical protein
MADKLTETQLALLRAGSLRDDRCIELLGGIKSAAARKSATRLMESGLAKELKSRPGMPIWRVDQETGKSYVLKLTTAGMKAAAEQAEQRADVAKEAQADKQPGHEHIKPSDAAPETNITGDRPSRPVSRTSPRDGTKLADVLALLQRGEGATLEALVRATGWLPHTTRAALSGLRKRGFKIVADRSEEQRASVYRAIGQMSGKDRDPASGSVEILR